MERYHKKTGLGSLDFQELLEREAVDPRLVLIFGQVYLLVRRAELGITPCPASFENLAVVAIEAADELRAAP